MIGACAASAAYGPEIYVVRAQDTLYSIAWRHDLDFREVAKWNNIGADYRVSVGQRLVLSPGGSGASAHTQPPPAVPPHPSTPAGSRATPQVGVATALPQPPSGPGASAGSAGVAASVGAAAASGGAGPGAGVAARRDVSAETQPGAPGKSGSNAPPGGGPVVGGNLKWVWPTDRTSAPLAVPGGGILLLGTLGQDVRAAGAGRVVYTGSGLRGYGNLIIIKHGDNLLSSYAHNREMLVHEGQDVLAGQTIAHMGVGAHQVSALYFEIRVNGKPTDPLRYLR